MALRITCVKKIKQNSLNEPHVSVGFYCWEDEESRKRGKTDRQTMVNMVKNGAIVYVLDDLGRKMYCFVNRDKNGFEFLQAKANNQPTDSLLNLVRWHL